MTDGSSLQHASVKQPASLSQRLTRIFMLVVLAIAGMYFLSGLYYNLTPWGIEGDNGIFAEMSRIQARGGLIFRDMWDIKPPGVFFYIVPFIYLFGNTLTAINVSVAFLNAVFPLLVGLLAFAVTRSRWAAVLAGGIAALYAVTNFVVETTLLMSAFGVAAYLCVALGRGRFLMNFAAGLLFIVGLLSKQPLIVELPILGLFALLYAPQKHRWSALRGLTLGLVAGGTGVLLWAFSNGIFESLVLHAFSSVSRYVLTSQGTWHFNNEESIGVMNQWLLGATIPQFAALVGWSVLSAVLAWRTGSNRRLLGIVLLWSLIALGAAAMGRILKPAYYMQLVAPLAILNALALPAYLRLGATWRLGGAAALLVTVFIYGQAFVHPVPDGYGTFERIETEAVEFIATNTEPGDCLWMWTTMHNQLNYLTERPSCTSAPFNGHVMDEWIYIIRPNQLEYMQELNASTPALHVFDGTWGYFPQLQAYANRYLGEKVFDNQRQQIYEVDRSMWHEADANFGNEIRLIGYDLLPTDGPTCPGDTLTLAMTWQQINTPSHQYQMFVQLLTQDETARLAGYDGPPENNRRSTATNTWVDVGEIRLGERFDMTLPADAAPGTYKLVVGLYDVEAPDQRVPVLDANGTQVGTYAVIDEVEIGCD
jgi:4-amino-4-deoxy-L-arabinose transferase-like glycosyltransferase